MLRRDKLSEKTRCDYEIALAGCPNVGKSTVFNHLTGLRQHTGNWSGKTVENAYGFHRHDDKIYKVVDLPGTYSLNGGSPEEKEALRYIKNGGYTCLIIVTSALTLERSMSFILRTLAECGKAILCVNMMDEAEKAGISIDFDKLKAQLGVPVTACSSRRAATLTGLKKAVYDLCEDSSRYNTDFFGPKELFSTDMYLTENAPATLDMLADSICKSVIKRSGGSVYHSRLDKLLTSKLTGVPAMLLMYGALFWITAAGANYPSELLSRFFAFLKSYLSEFLRALNVPDIIEKLITDGVYTTLSWVVSVMLPPMAIFFPLFAIMEDSGYLPRIAFNLDGYFRRARADSKQSLTMAMGMGCNACGVMGCRIIGSRRERDIALVTNNFIPCNGRLPSLIAIISIFFASASDGEAKPYITALIMVGVFAVSVTVTLVVSRILSGTVFKGDTAGFVMELPPYRRPEIIKTIIRSFADKTIPVLLRAVYVACPAGAVIWILNNTVISGTPLSVRLAGFLDPLGAIMGLDGIILLAFILGFPANETVIPVMLTVYLSSGVMIDCGSYKELSAILIAHGWTALTALCFLTVCVFHFPCSTTCLTLYKETRSLKLTAVAIALPTAIGIMTCMLISAFANLFHTFF